MGLFSGSLFGSIMSSSGRRKKEGAHISESLVSRRALLADEGVDLPKVGRKLLDSLVVLILGLEMAHAAVEGCRLTLRSVGRLPLIWKRQALGALLARGRIAIVLEP